VIERLRKAVVALNALQHQGLIESYAIGGGMAVNFYTDPQSTYDLDVFILVKPDAARKVISLTDVYQYLKSQGGTWEEGHIVLDQLPLQLIAAGNALEHEAVDRAHRRNVAGVEAKVVSVEYLAAIAVQTGRRKDREKVRRLLEEASLDRRALEALLKRHDLYETFKRWELQNRD